MSAKRRAAIIAAEASGEIYLRLRNAIVSERFQPNERLVEADLVREFATSRTTIRGALIRLEQEGLVIHDINRGSRVRLVTEKEAVEMSEARAALEMVAARHAASKATAADIAELRRIVAEMKHRIRESDLMGYSDLNAQLHQKIRSVSANETINRLLATLNSQSIRFQYRTILHPGRPSRSLAEHEAIVDAIGKHDPDRAETMMRTHLMQVVQTLRDAISAQLLRGR